MTKTRGSSSRRLDVASLLLLLIGLVSAVGSCWLIGNSGFNALVIVPSIIAATVGATHLLQREASRDTVAGELKRP